MGHNQGPPIAEDSAWNFLSWKKAQKKAWKTPPIEIVRLRLERAAKLGLTYRQFTTVLLDRGIYLRAIFFELAGTLVRSRNNGVEIDRHGHIGLLPGVLEKLACLRTCHAFVTSNLAGRAQARGDDTRAPSFVEQINRLCGGTITDYRIGNEAAAKTSGRHEIRPNLILNLLAKYGLSPSVAVMVGNGERDSECARDAKLAKFIPAGAYFGHG